MGSFLVNILGKAYFIVNARAGQFDDFGWCESYAKPDFISVRTRLPLYKGDVGVHYLKVLVKRSKRNASLLPLLASKVKRMERCWLFGFCKKLSTLPGSRIVKVSRSI